MDFSSLPNYPTPPRSGSAACAKQTDQELSLRVTRIFLDLVLLVAIVAMLYWLRQTATAIEHPLAPPPLDFKLVQERFDKVHMWTSREEVEKLLGPPSPGNVWKPDFIEWQELAERSHRDLGIPSDRVWDRWADTKDEDKFVAVLFAEGRVYYKAKKGF